jgi:hypothetical protein
VDVLTQHGDERRSGVNTREKILSPKNVNPQTFGRKFHYPVLGQVYAQPLIVTDVPVRIGNNLEQRNLCIIATMTNIVYAFDADGKNEGNMGLQFPYWIARLGAAADPDPKLGPPKYKDILGPIGILSTPVIDPDKHFVYAVAFTKENSDESAFTHRIHKIDLSTGQILQSQALGVKEADSLPGKGSQAGSDDGGPFEADVVRNGRIVFRSEKHLQRTGLLYEAESHKRPMVHVAFAGIGDHRNYHGWIFSCDAASLKCGPTWISTDRENAMGGIWQSGQGLTSDGKGHLLLVTGNGDFNATMDDQGKVHGTSFGSSAVRLGLSGKDGDRPIFKVQDFFTPHDRDDLDAADLDLGVAGLGLFKVGIPNSPVNTVALIASKEGYLYVLDPKHLGGQDTDPNAQDDNGVVLHSILATDRNPQFGVDKENPQDGSGYAEWNIHGTPVYWEFQDPKLKVTRGLVFVMGESDRMRSFELVPGADRPLELRPLTTSRQDIQVPVGMPGGFMTVSSDGKDPNSGIVWVLHQAVSNANNATRPGILRAFRATNLGHLVGTPEAGPDTGLLWQSLPFHLSDAANSITGPPQEPMASALRQDVFRDDVQHFGKFAKFAAPTVANGKVYVPTFDNQVVVYGLK